MQPLHGVRQQDFPLGHDNAFGGRPIMIRTTLVTFIAAVAAVLGFSAPAFADSAVDRGTTSDTTALGQQAMAAPDGMLWLAGGVLVMAIAFVWVMLSIRRDRVAAHTS